MGIFVNPNNGAFQVALNSEIYVDKTGLIAYTNKVMDTNNSLICNSRPRRFGKSITANMLTAYYSKGCDSSAMFTGRKISTDDVDHIKAQDEFINLLRGLFKGTHSTEFIHLAYLTGILPIKKNQDPISIE